MLGQIKKLFSSKPKPKVARKHNSMQRAADMYGFKGSGKSVLKQTKDLRKHSQVGRSLRKSGASHAQIMKHHNPNWKG